jgi:tetratricopeptide (TPR) repeat protein
MKHLATIERVILVIFCLLCFVSCNNNKRFDQKVKQLSSEKSKIRENFLLYKSGNDTVALRKALAKADSLFDTDLYDLELFQLKGEILRARKDYAGFARLMEKGTAYFPDNPQSYFGAGLAYLKIGEEEKANLMFGKCIKKYDQLIADFPSLHNYINRAVAFSFLYDKEEGIKEFNKIKKLNLFPEPEVNNSENMFHVFDKEQFVNNAFLN